MNYNKWASIIAAVFGFLSFHFLYSDGWSFDGTWTKLRELKERMWPAKENRVVGWWHGPFGYACAIISTIGWIVAALNSK